MQIDDKWLKSHFLCDSGLVSVVNGENNFSYDHNDLIDKYIKKFPLWMGFFCGMLIEDNLTKLKMAIELIDKYDYLIDTTTDETIEIFNHIKDMVFNNNKMYMSEKIQEYINNKDNRKTKGKFLVYILCLYIKLDIEKNKEYTTKILGALVEHIVDMQKKLSNATDTFKYYYKAALHLRKILNAYIEE